MADFIDGGRIQAADPLNQFRFVHGSRLFSIALEKYLRDRRNEEMLEKLNRVYAGEPDPEDRRIVAGFNRNSAQS